MNEIDLAAFTAALRAVCAEHRVSLQPFHNNNGTGGIMLQQLEPGADPLASLIVELWD